MYGLQRVSPPDSGKCMVEEQNLEPLCGYTEGTQQTPAAARSWFPQVFRRHDIRIRTESLTASTSIRLSWEEAESRLRASGDSDISGYARTEKLVRVSRPFFFFLFFFFWFASVLLLLLLLWVATITDTVHTATYCTGVCSMSQCPWTTLQPQVNKVSNNSIILLIIIKEKRKKKHHSFNSMILILYPLNTLFHSLWPVSGPPPVVPRIATRSNFFFS